MILSTRADVHRFLMMNGFNVSDRAVRDNIKRGSIPTNASGTWDTESALAWAEKNIPEKRVSTVADLASPTAEPFDDGGNEALGLEAALDRLRRAEATCYRRWNESPGKKEFDAWSTSVDILRRAEKNLTDHMVATKDLLPAGEVRAWIFKHVTAAKRYLLDIPGKVAPDLEGLPWPEIQKTLEKEVRHALERLPDHLD